MVSKFILRSSQHAPRELFVVLILIARTVLWLYLSSKPNKTTAEGNGFYLALCYNNSNNILTGGPSHRRGWFISKALSFFRNLSKALLKGFQNFS